MSELYFLPRGYRQPVILQWIISILRLAHVDGQLCTEYAGLPVQLSDISISQENSWLLKSSVRLSMYIANRVSFCVEMQCNIVGDVKLKVFEENSNCSSDMVSIL